MTKRQARELIAAIDHYHGNELKDRSERSIRAEASEIVEILATMVEASDD